MTDRRKHSVEPRERRKNNWRMQALKEMVWLVPSITPMALGTTPIVYQISRKERLQRKKYIGLCRLLLLHTRAIMDALPITVRVFISANSTTKETRNCHVPGKPRRMNSSTLVPFAVSFQMPWSVCKERKVSVKVCMLVLVLQMLQVARKRKITIPENTVGAQHGKMAFILC